MGITAGFINKLAIKPQDINYKFYKLAIFLLNLLSTQLFLIFVYAVCVSETVYLLVASVMVKH